MKDEDKTKGQLMKELEQLRRRVTEMEAIEVKHMASEAALKMAEEEKETILDSLVEHVVYHDMEMRVLWANRAACDSVGMTREEVVGGHCYELWAKRSEACEDCPVQLASQTGQPQAVEKTTPDGRSWYIQGSPVRDSNGDIVGMVELTLDITERKRAEEGLRQVHDELEKRVEKRTAELVRANEQLRQEIRERMQAEEELGRYKLIVSTVNEPLSFIDSNYIYRTVNDAYTEVFNRPREEIIGRSVAEMFGTEIFEKQIKSYLARCFNGEEVHYRDWLDFPDGKRRCMLISYYPFFENDKSVSALVVKTHDMTDLELAQEALRKSERTLNAILAASPMGIGLVRNRILGWTNKAMYRMWGYEEGSLLGQSIEVLYPDAEEYERVGRDFYSEIEKWGIGQVETRWLTKDGRVIDCYLQGSPLDSSDISKGVIVAAMDITERKRMEEVSRESEKFTSSLLNNSPNAIMVVNSDTSIRYINSAFERLTGFFSSEILGSKPPYPWWPEEASERIAVDFDEAIQKGVNRFEVVFQKKNGERFWVEITGIPVRKNGRFDYYLSNWVNITERKGAEQALRESEATARALLNAPADLVMLLDTKGVFLDVNEATARRFNRSVEELTGMCAWDLFESEVAERRKGAVDKVIETGKSFQFEEERQGAWWDTIVYPVLDSEGNATRIAVVARDITERKLAVEQLRESEERYRSLVDNITVGIALISPDMEILTMNNQLKEWFSDIDPATRPLCYQVFNDPPGEKVCSYCPTIQSLQDGQVHEATTETPAGDQIRNYRIISSPVKDKAGKIIAAIEMIDDVTKGKQREKQIRRLSQELITAQEVARQRIAADLHDHVAQDLASLKINLDALYADQTDTLGERRQRVFELSKLTQHSILAIRDMAYGLHPAGLKEFGVAHTVRQYCEEFAGKNSLVVDLFSVGMDELELDFDTEIALYRLIQEGLTNIRKHAADASHVNVRLSATVSHIMLHIEDNGKGFEVNKRLAAALDEKRMGIWNMEQRVAFLNGEMKIESGLAHGTKILIKVPHMDKTNG